MRAWCCGLPINERFGPRPPNRPPLPPPYDSARSATTCYTEAQDFFLGQAALDAGDALSCASVLVRAVSYETQTLLSPVKVTA